MKLFLYKIKMEERVSGVHLERLFDRALLSNRYEPDISLIVLAALYYQSDTSLIAILSGVHLEGLFDDVLARGAQRHYHMLSCTVRAFRKRQSPLGPVDPSLRALSGRPKFTGRRNNYNKDSPSFEVQGFGDRVWGLG